MHVLILDKNPATRLALGLLLTEPGVTASAGSNLASAMPGTSEPVFDVALVDERIAGAGTEDASATLRSLSRHAPVVVMGMGEPAQYEAAHVAAGAVGYWARDGDIDRLVALVRAAGLVGQADRACVAAKRSTRARFAYPSARRAAAVA